MEQQPAKPLPARSQTIEIVIDTEVVLLRDQDLSDADLITFSRRFGDLHVAPNQETGQRFVKGHPETYVVSNVVENGRAIGSLGAGEAVGHTNMSYQVNPPKASMLYAKRGSQAFESSTRGLTRAAAVLRHARKPR